MNEEQEEKLVNAFMENLDQLVINEKLIPRIKDGLAQLSKTTRNSIVGAMQVGADFEEEVVVH